MCVLIDILAFAQNKRDRLGKLAFQTKNDKIISKYWDACIVAKQFEKHYNFVENNCWEYYFSGIIKEMPDFAIGE